MLLISDDCFLYLLIIIIKRSTYGTSTMYHRWFHGDDLLDANGIFTHFGLGYFNEILYEYLSSQLQWLVAKITAVKLPLEECH